MVAMQELYRYEPVVSPDGEERDRWVSLGIAPHSPKITRFRQAFARAGQGESRA